MMEVISTRRYEVRPPATSSSYPGIIVDPENSVALVKEEEWETRKKKEITTTRQIETRVKRQVVLEDGEVVVDSGPLVTTNTTEDVEQQEHTTQERRTTGDHPQEVEWPTNGTIDGSVVQKELNETVVRSREEIEERLETEDRQQLGDISDEAYQKAIRNNRGDLRIALAESTKQIIPQSGPRVIHHTTRSNKVVDTEKTSEKQELKADGSIVTEKKQTIEHEEVNDDEVPDDGSGIGGDNASETRKEASQKFLRKREEDVVDYVSGGERIAREMRYVAETTEGERIGDWVPPPTTMRTNRLHKHSSFAGENAPAARKDALTKKPLDFEEEDEARKFETSKWLESHFGSESRSSHGSIDADDSPLPPSTNISYINVTMKSCSTPKERREYQNFDSSRYNRRTTGRDSTSPSGYFHGISEWSERYQGNEKENDHVRTASPSHYADAPRVNGHSYERGKNQMESTYCRSYESVRRREECVQERQRTPSPPVRRKNRDQWSTRSMEKPSPNKSTSGRTSSPIHVVQRTWESRSRDVQEQNAERDTYKRPPPPPRSRSTSPKQVTIVQEEKKPSESTGTSRPSKSSGQSKYKIGESFRKLVGKLRSASTERKNKRSSSSSTSQLTQTEDNGPTYMQYNVVDRNIPLVSDREAEEKPPERPPRSPRNSGVQVKPPKTIRTSDHGTNHYDQSQSRSSDATTPVHRYYLGEDPFGGSIYGREKGYAGARRPGRSRGKTSVETDHSSLDRFSRSTSRLVMDREMDEQFRSAQTLPRNMHSGGRSGRQQQTSLAPSTSRRQQQVRTTVGRTSGTSSTMAPSRQYGSMINISIKNAVVSPKPQTLQPPVKPERTYRSSLSRSKSFNVEADKNGNDAVPLRIPCKSSLQLNRLDETPPLKSPGILASISRSNRDLFRDSRCDH